MKTRMNVLSGIVGMSGHHKYDECFRLCYSGVEKYTRQKILKDVFDMVQLDIGLFISKNVYKNIYNDKQYKSILKELQS